MMDDFNQPKKKKPTLGIEVLHQLFESGDSALSQQFIRWKVWKKWEDYVGKSFASICEPVGYRQGTLHVWVKNSTWMQQLIFSLEPMKSAINQKLGFEYVKVIHLTLDRKKVPSSTQEMEQLKKSVQSLMKNDEE